MTAAAILAIVVATSEVQDPATAIMIGAAGESLGPDVAIRLLGEEQPEGTDPEKIERELGAGAVVTLAWRDATHLHARLRLHVAANGHTTTRELVFSEADTRVERGRTLGLAAASMWPEIRGPAPGSAPLPAAARPAERASTEARPAPSAAAERPSPPVTARKGRVASADIPRFAVGLAAQGATGLTGEARGIGARIESTFRVGGSWALRAALSARTGPVSGLSNGADLTAALAGGVEWWPVALRAAGARLGLRADALVLRNQVSGAVAAGEAENHGRFLPGFDLLAQAALRISARIDLVAAAGGELALGNTEIRTGSPPGVVAEIRPFRLVAEVGLRVGF